VREPSAAKVVLARPVFYGQVERCKRSCGPVNLRDGVLRPGQRCGFSVRSDRRGIGLPRRTGACARTAGRPPCWPGAGGAGPDGAVPLDGARNAGPDWLATPGGGGPRPTPPAPLPQLLLKPGLAALQHAGSARGAGRGARLAEGRCFQAWGSNDEW